MFSFGTVLALSQTLQVQAQSVPAAVAGTTPPAIVIGFVGGFVGRDNLAHAEVQLAASLRTAFPVGVHVETFESYRGKRARRKVMALLDTDLNGTLSHDEKQKARIIVYGHSWGGSEAVNLARELEKEGIPVLLTVQVDSISKIRQNDSLIPANVAQAINFYQPHGLLRGEPKIRAADPARTKIIGNFRFDYHASPYTCAKYPWYDRVFVKAHTQIECDPGVWEQVKSLMVSSLQQQPGSSSPTGR